MLKKVIKWSENQSKTSETGFYSGMRMRSIPWEKELAKQGHGFISNNFLETNLPHLRGIAKAI